MKMPLSRGISMLLKVRYERGADVIERMDFIFDSVVREPYELKHIMSRNNLLSLHWPPVKNHFWSAISEK